MRAGAEVVEVRGHVVVGEVATRDGEVAGRLSVQRPEVLELGGGDVAQATAAAALQHGLELCPSVPAVGNEVAEGHRARLCSCR